MKTPKQGKGRPVLPESERRTDKFTIRVNALEKQLLESAHAYPSTWAREILLKAALKSKHKAE